MSGKKIKVVRIITRLNIGGPSIHAISLSSSLDRERFEQVLVYGNELQEEGSMRELARDKNIRAVFMPEMTPRFRLGLSDFKALLKLCSLIRKEKPHIVHTHTAKAGFLGRVAAWLVGVPVVLHTYHGHILYGYFGPIKNFVLRCMERIMALLTYKIIAVSERVKSDLVLLRICHSKKIVIIPLGLDLKSFLECKNHKGKFRKEIKLPENCFVVGIVGRIFAIKNHKLFLEAASLVNNKIPNTHFVIIGDGTLRKREEGHAKRLGISDKVFFAGWRDDLSSIYADMDVLVVSSNNEGTPVSAIEAMASGVAVIATAVGGTSDLINHSTTGMLVEPENADRLSKEITQLIENTTMRKNIEKQAQAYVAKKYTIERLLEDMKALYIKSVDAKVF